MIPIRTVVVLLAAMAATAGADETPIYESLSEVAIGRVFFSHAERTRLDKLRGGNAPLVSRAPRPGKTKRQLSASDPAGFIRSKSGKTRVYNNGDFVVADAQTVIRFPDDVAVKRKDNNKDDEPD